jgi:hypothetical protein
LLEFEHWGAKLTTTALFLRLAKMAFPEDTENRLPADPRGMLWILRSNSGSQFFLRRQPTDQPRCGSRSARSTAPATPRPAVRPTRAVRSFLHSTTDQKTWTNAPATLQAKTVIVGLTSGTIYYFRFRGVIKTGEVAFSQVVQIPVS